LFVNPNSDGVLWFNNRTIRRFMGVGEAGSHNHPLHVPSVAIPTRVGHPPVSQAHHGGHAREPGYAAARRFFRSTKPTMDSRRIWRPRMALALTHELFVRTFGKMARHRTNAYLSNRFEQDHRGTRALARQTASAASTTNFAIFSVPVPITINLFQRRSAAIACSATPQLRSTSFKPFEQNEHVLHRRRKRRET
jgi:hypothetical protein